VRKKRTPSRCAESRLHPRCTPFVARRIRNARELGGPRANNACDNFRTGTNFEVLDEPVTYTDPVTGEQIVLYVNHVTTMVVSCP
jgi:hypothetical protein